MSDKLEWMNRHFTLIRCKTLQEAIENEKYVCRPDLPEFYNKTSVEDIIWDFANAGRYKCAVDLMAYVGHHRAVIWWGYQCLKSLGEEVRINPPKPIDIDSIGTSFEPKVPDFAKVELPKPDPEKLKKLDEIPGLLDENLKKTRAMCNPKLLAEFEEYMELFYSEFEKVHHIRPLDLIKKLQEINQQDLLEGHIDMNSPIFKECEKIKTELQNVRKETLDTIHAVLPTEPIEYKKKKAVEIADAIYRWVVAPDEVNSKICLEMGNAFPQLPNGILAYCAYWAWGDMMPDHQKDLIVKTPAGLMANGFTQFLLMCASLKGGTRKLKERYEEYFKLGVEVLTGKNLWDKSVISGEVPHEELIKQWERENQEQEKAEKRMKIPAVQESKVDSSELAELERRVTQDFRPTGRTTKKYTRWTPDQK